MTWYEDEVKRVVKERDSCRYVPETIFYGSSSFTLWKSLYTDFKQAKPLNLGFGGSTLAACTWFFNRIVSPLTAPKQLFIYAGDNDLGDGRHPEEVAIFFQQLQYLINGQFKNLPCYFISIKPSIKRSPLLQKIRHTNSLIENTIAKENNSFKYLNIYNLMLDKNGKPVKEFFAPDGLHLSDKGYALWKEKIMETLL